MRKREGVDFTSGVSILISGLGQQHQVSFLPALRLLLGDESLAYIRCATYYERNLCRYFWSKQYAVHNVHMLPAKSNGRIFKDKMDPCVDTINISSYISLYTLLKRAFFLTHLLCNKKRERLQKIEFTQCIKSQFVIK